MSKYECDNCDWSTTNDDDMKPLSSATDLCERLDAGSVVPHGICPECDCFCYETTVHSNPYHDLDKVPYDC